MANGRSRKRKKVRYSEIRIRLSYKQKRSLINYCHARQTTPNKLIKKMIRKYISNFADDVPEEYYVTENQLDIFAEMDEEIGVEFIDEEEEEEEKEIISIEYQVSSNESQVSGGEANEADSEKPPTLF